MKRESKPIDIRLKRTLNIFFTILILFIFGLFLYEGYSEIADYSFTEDEIFDWSNDWYVLTDSGTKDEITLPVKLDVEEGKYVTITKELPDTIKKYNCLMYESRHQDVRISVGGVSRYVYSDMDSRLFGESSPNAIILVPLYSSDEGYEIDVSISANSAYAGSIGKFYLGNERSILLMLIKENILWVVLCISLFVMAIVCFVCFCVYRNTMREGKAFGYLFWLALLSGLWSFANLEIRQMFVGNLRFHENLGYLCMILFPLFIIGLSNWISENEHIHIYSLGLISVILNFFVQTILYVLKLCDFFEMNEVTDFLAIMILGAMIYILATDIKGGNRSAHFSLIGVLALFIAEIVNIVVALNGRGESCAKPYTVCLIIYISVNMFHIILNINRKEQLRKDAESANQSKSKFLAVMSHEIRTPINAVLGMNEMIARESHEKHIQEYSTSIADAGKSLLSLINDILDFSKIEAGKMNIVCTEYSMKSLIRDLSTIVKGRIENKELNLVLNIDSEIPSMFWGDEVRIKQVLVNLLTNAAKYTESGAITFTVEKRETIDDIVELYFSVRDTGSGIKEKDIELLMTSSFVRVDEEKNSGIEGTGLGLAITRQLLELMDSKLEIDSTYGEGSDFHFVLKQKIIDSSPIGHVAAARNSKPKKFEPGFTIPKAKILAVDDNKVNLMVLHGLLKAYGCQLITCTSGEKCIELCKENPEEYNLIFLDHMMPGMDGIETLKLLREGIIPDSIKVIALTANAISGAEEMYRESGFDGYLSKPIDFALLEKYLKDCLPTEYIIKNIAKG